MEKMRFNVGDCVRIKNIDWYNENKDKFGEVHCKGLTFVNSMKQYCNSILTIEDKREDCYSVKENAFHWTDEMIEGLVEEKVSYDIDSEWLKHEISLPKGYIFKDENGNIINATKIVLEKKKREYPKTYEECAEIVEDCADCSLKCFACGLLNNLQMLLLCRDAYWKIAGAEMGLGEPWEPDWDDENQEKYIIGSWLGTIQGLEENFVSHPFAFPTSEMRYTFYENFKEKIEQCKELL